MKKLLFISLVLLLSLSANSQITITSIKCTVKFAQSETISYNIQFLLEKEGDSWKVYPMDDDSQNDHVIISATTLEEGLQKCSEYKTGFKQIWVYIPNKKKTGK